MSTSGSGGSGRRVSFSSDLPGEGPPGATRGPAYVMDSTPVAGSAGRGNGLMAEDAGGPFRELYALMAERLTANAEGAGEGGGEAPLLRPTADGSLLPAPSSSDARPVAALRGLGRLLALSILRATPLNVSFSRCLYKVRAASSLPGSGGLGWLLCLTFA